MRVRVLDVCVHISVYVCVFSTLWRIVSPLVVGCQLSLQIEQMSFNCPTFLEKHTDVRSQI